ncbi:hypothetical protein FB45DRAFT_920175 [Roridomyces roridus]|uniref:Uncharacterized protein n=1 Tax=Roridomyces roridus TaxID=1738132 RepID=A0AAD7FJ42_9AGAR|nr:hypothetical protein FB45DRAFT_920175 [Roridomyces roridus]
MGAQVSYVAYVHYRVYTTDGPIPSKTAFDPRNPYIGRIAATSVPPPHNTASLKRCMAKAEGISGSTVLFGGHLDYHPMADTAWVTLSSDSISTAGAWPERPFVLKVTDELSPGEAAAVEAIDVSQYVANGHRLYYQLYTPTDEDPVRHPPNASKPAVGVIERFRIPPPVEPGSIKRCIAQIEQKPIYRFANLFADINAQTPLQNLSDHYWVRNGSLGTTAERPIVLVQPEHTNGLMFRPFSITGSSPVPGGFAASVLKVGRQGSTDGVVRMTWASGDPKKIQVYTAEVNGIQANIAVRE